MRRFASKGYVRNQLLVVNGGAANGTTGMSVGTVTQSSTTVTASGVSQELAGSTGSAEAYAVEATVVRQVDSRLERVREARSEEHTSELQSLMRISYAVFFLKNKQKDNNNKR